MWFSARWFQEELHDDTRNNVHPNQILNRGASGLRRLNRNSSVWYVSLVRNSSHGQHTLHFSDELNSYIPDCMLNASISLTHYKPNNEMQQNIPIIDRRLLHILHGYFFFELHQQWRRKVYYQSVMSVVERVSYTAILDTRGCCLLLLQWSCSL